MTNIAATGRQELEFRRRWYRAHMDRWREASERGDQDAVSSGAIRVHAPDGLRILEALRRNGDLIEFRDATQTWSATQMKWFNGYSGQMFINQLVNSRADPQRLARLLPEVLSPPADDDQAYEKIRAMTDFVEKIRVGSHPASGHIPFCLSFLWWLADPSRPVAWKSSTNFIEVSTGEALPTEPSERYARFVELVTELDTDYSRYEEVTGWWDRQAPLFLDVVLSDRCEFGWKVLDEEHAGTLSSNARALRGIARHIGVSLKDELSEYIGRDLKVVLPSTSWKPGRPRADLLIDWRLPEQYAPGLRLWINHLGMTICASPGIGPPDQYGGKGTETRWYDKTAQVVSRLHSEGFEITNCQGSNRGQDRGFLGRAGSFVYGRWYGKDQLKGLDLPSECRAIVPQLRPILAKWMDLYHGSVGPGVHNGEDPVEAAAESLLVDRSFLDDIVELLRDKGQVILYGPPGTGKTYLAQRLAKALAPDPADRSLVQFHPSTSYEDFFEGYRPGEGPDGQIVYRLTPGPLARMVERAAGDHGRRQVMIIDEINRANLPKVLGELLFLLEYRDRSISTLYRPDAEFELPESLWFIGTMNTADRSIALVDAALRRRFHFVPFFPDRGPTEGLLDRWLEREGEPSWVAKLVEMVNKELTEAIGADLQLGPSHFMKTDYLPVPDPSDKRLRRIWEYNIEPLIEDQLFGDAGRIRQFRFENVMGRYLSSSGSDGPDGEAEDASDQPASDTPAT